MNEKRYSLYESFVRDRAAKCGYPSLADLADALGISLRTLMGRLRNRSAWTSAECDKLQDVLRLNPCEWVSLTLYHTSPYDTSYPSLAYALFASTWQETLHSDLYDYDYDDYE